MNEQLVKYLKFGSTRVEPVKLLKGHTYVDDDGVYEMLEYCLVDAVQVYVKNNNGGGTWRFSHYLWSTVRAHV